MNNELTFRLATAESERRGEPDIYNVEEDDDDMNKAIKSSRDTLLISLTR